MPLYGMKCVRSSKPTKTPRGERVNGVIYIPLPEDKWEPRPGGREGHLDTLAVSANGGQEKDVTWMVHRPDLHGAGLHTIDTNDTNGE